MVDAARELVQAAMARGRPHQKRSGGIVGMRNQREQLLDDRIGDRGSLRFARYLRPQRRHFMALPALITGEEERAVPDNRPAYAVAVNISVKRNDRAGRIEIVLRVESLVAQKLVGGPMKAVRARFRNGVDDDSGVASIFGVERIGLHLEFLNHVDI